MSINGIHNLASPATPKLQANGKQNEVREHFTQFVGEAFYGQLIKSMQSTVGKPAYFHGGRAEEVFQGQLNQALSEHLTKATADQFAEPMYERQFPQFARVQQQATPPTLDELRNLRRS